MSKWTNENRKYEMTFGNLSRRHLLSDCRSVIRIIIIISSAQQVGAITVSLSTTWRREALKSGNTKASAYSSKSIHRNQASLQFLVYLLLSAPVTVLKTSLSANLKSATVLFGLRLRFLSFFKALCLRISTGLSRVSSWSLECSNFKTHSASYVPICALCLMYRVWAKRCNLGNKCIHVHAPGEPHTFASTSFKTTANFGRRNKSKDSKCETESRLKWRIA